LGEEERDRGRAWGGRAGFVTRRPLLVAWLPALLLVLVLGGLLLGSPGPRHDLGVAWGLLVEGEPDALREWLLDFGGWAPLVSALLQLATSLVPPLPSFLLGIANAMLYGPLLGGILTWITAMGAAAACFGLARMVGRPGIQRIVREESLQRVDRFMERRGVLTVFLARLIPFINPDVASYAAGVTGMGWRAFLLAMGAGAIPSTVFYSVVGAAALESTAWIIVLVAIASLAPLPLLLHPRVRRWWRGGGERAPEAEGAPTRRREPLP